MLTAIVLLPLLGFVLNGVLATRLGGNRFGPRFVSAAGCGLPIASFLLVVKAVLELRAGGWAPLVETVYRWALIGENSATATPIRNCVLSIAAPAADANDRERRDHRGDQQH